MYITTKTICEEKDTHVCYIDLLRVVACFLVIVNHTNSEIFLGTVPSFTWFISLTYFFICKPAVPIFLMISGYTMLDKQDTYLKMITRLIRHISVIVIFSGIYYIFYDAETLRITTFIKKLFSNSITNAYWYLYLYLGVILMLPFLQKMVLNFKRIDYHIFFVWSGLFISLWPIIVHYIPSFAITSRFSIPLFDGFICLLLLGAYIKKYCFPSLKWKIVSIIGFVVSCATSVMLTCLEYIDNNGENYLFYDKNTMLPIVISSVCLFYFASTVKMGELLRKISKVLGELTFGIYLISDLLIKEFKFLLYDMLNMGINSMLAVIIYELFIFTTGAVIIWIIRKLPLVKKLI